MQRGPAILRQTLVFVLALLLAAAAQGQTSQSSRPSASVAQATSFVPERSIAYQGVDGLEIYLVRKDEVIRLFTPYTEAPKGPQLRHISIAAGKSPVQAQYSTGPDAVQRVLPVGPAIAHTTPLHQEPASKGSVFLAGMQARGAYRSHGEDSIILTVERLVFPSAGVLRVNTVQLPVWVLPP